MPNISMYTGTANSDGKIFQNDRGPFGILQIKLDNPYGKDFCPMLFVKGNGEVGQFLASFKAGERLLIEGHISVDKGKDGKFFTALQANSVAQMGDFIKNSYGKAAAPKPSQASLNLDDEIPF